MYYYGYFRNTDTSKDKNGQLYKVVIITDFQNNGYTKEGGELILTSSPFTVNYKGEDDNLFKPYKCSTATVSFYLDKINKDFYSVRGNDILVTLFKLKDGVTPKEVNFGSGNLTDINYPSNYDYRDYTVEWIGFATPNAFNQSYNSDFNMYEMQAQDALSTLQYYDYISCTTDNGNNTISDILLNVISSVGIYKNIYISDNLHTPTSDYDGRDITEYLSIYEGNFFNEDGEAKKMLEVLSDIMQYLNMTAVAFGDNLFILDYTAIANKYNIYHWIKSEVTERRGSIIVTLEDNLPWVYKEGRYYNKFKNMGTVELEHYKDIDINDIADSNINYSLGSTYNKVKVIDDFYYRDKIDIFKGCTNSTEVSTLTTFDPIGMTSTGSGIKLTVEKSTENYTRVKCNKDNTFINVYYNTTNNPIVTTYAYKDYYDMSTEGNSTVINQTWEYEPITFDNWSYNQTRYKTGAILAKELILKPNENKLPSFKDVIYFVTPFKDQKTGNWKSHTMNNSYFWDDEKTLNQIMIDFNLKNETINKGDYLLLNGVFNFYYCVAPVERFELTNSTTSLQQKEHYYNWAKLECGGSYWNGTEWVSSVTYFKLPFNSSDFAITENVGINEGLTKTGYGIPLPVENTTVTNIKLSLCRGWGFGVGYEVYLTTLRDFTIEVVSPVDDIFESEINSNTEYTNIINNSAIEEYDNINLPVTTYNGKDKDYSTVYCTESYLDSSLTPMYRLARYYNTSTGFLCSAEEHIINNITTQYQLPNTIFDITLYGNYKPYSLVTYKHFEDVTFVVDGMSIDYAANNTTLHLVEKIIGSHNRQITLQTRSKKRDYQRNGDIINNAHNVKKDDKVITNSYIAGDANIYRDGMIVSLDAVGDTLIDWDNPLALDSKSAVRQAYLRFSLNNNGELNIYYPNSLLPTARINENGELLVEPIKDGIIEI